MAVRNGAPSANKSSAWSAEARAIMKAASAGLKLFEQLPGFTLGAMTSSVPEVSLIVLLLDPDRPMVPLLSLPINEGLRTEVQDHAEKTIGQNKRGSAAAKTAADSAQRSNPITSYHGAEQMSKIVNIMIQGGVFIAGTNLEHKQETIIGAVLEALLVNANEFLAAYSRYSDTHMTGKGAGRTRSLQAPSDVIAFAAGFGVYFVIQSIHPQSRTTEELAKKAAEAVRLEAEKKAADKEKRQLKKLQRLEAEAGKKTAEEASKKSQGVPKATGATAATVASTGSSTIQTIGRNMAQSLGLVPGVVSTEPPKEPPRKADEKDT
eukprot:1057431-Amphidinium_carterae.1